MEPLAWTRLDKKKFFFVGAALFSVCCCLRILQGDAAGVALGG